MSTITYDEVNLMLRLYDMRREARLRQARSWFLDHFHPMSPDEMTEKYAPGTDEYNNIRMVISYWDMVASIVNRGLINDELFFESNGEMWVVWDRIRSIVPTWRAAFKNPMVFMNIEEACRRLDAGPGHRHVDRQHGPRRFLCAVPGQRRDARGRRTAHPVGGGRHRGKSAGVVTLASGLRGRVRGIPAGGTRRSDRRPFRLTHE